MRKLMLILGVILVIAAVVALAYAALSLFGYYHVLDGSSALYSRLHSRAILFFIVGGVLLAIGIVSFIVRGRL